MNSEQINSIIIIKKWFKGVEREYFKVSSTSAETFSTGFTFENFSDTESKLVIQKSNIDHSVSRQIRLCYPKYFKMEKVTNS